MNSQRKARLFVVLGMFALAFAMTVSTRFHLDFAAGFGYTLGIGFLILGVVGLRRGSAAELPEPNARN
jgi:uncharacterized membrane protein